MGIKHDNFIRISHTRIDKIIDMISKLSNLNNRSFYEFTEDEADAMFDRIQKELDKQKSEFKKNQKHYKYEL